MKSTLLLLFLLISPRHSFASADSNIQLWKEGDRFYSLKKDPDGQTLLSSDCFNSEDTCEALKAMKKKLKLTFAQKELSGGKNPNSLKCSKGHQGRVLILKDDDGNENSFCRFSDGSLVSTSDL